MVIVFRGWGGKVALAFMGDGLMGIDQTLTTSPALLTRPRGLSPLSLGERLDESSNLPSCNPELSQKVPGVRVNVQSLFSRRILKPRIAPCPVCKRVKIILPSH